jgi:putative FmdB family regulatory protein
MDSKRKEKEKLMPSYEYDCMPCGMRYVKVRSMSLDDPGYQCDTCNKPLVRVYSDIGVTFNGSGFYKTDNRKVK